MQMRKAYLFGIAFVVIVGLLSIAPAMMKSTVSTDCCMISDSSQIANQESIGTLPLASALPEAFDDTYLIDEDTSLVVGAPGILENDYVSDELSLTALLETGPTHGQLTLSPDGSFTYIPLPNFAGTDSFTYYANDGTSDSNVASVTITVQEVVSDTTPPTTTLSLVGSQGGIGWYVSDVTVTLDATDDLTSVATTYYRGLSTMV